MFKYTLSEVTTSTEALFGADKFAKFLSGGSRGLLKSLNDPSGYISSALRSPDPDYKMPRFPTKFNVDQSKFHPAWPTIKTGDKTIKDVVWKNGVDADDLINKVKKYEHAVELVAVLTDSIVDKSVYPNVAAVVVSKIFSSAFAKNDIIVSNGKAKSVRLVHKDVIWPSDKWFTDVNYSIFETIKKYDLMIGKWCPLIAKLPNFKINQEKVSGNVYGITTMNDIIDLLLHLHTSFMNNLYPFYARMNEIKRKVCK